MNYAVREFSPSMPTSLLALLITLGSILRSRLGLEFEILALRHKSENSSLRFFSRRAQTQNQRSHNRTAAKQAAFPLQLEIRVPFEPTAFPSGPYVYLFYELHLANSCQSPSH